MPEVIEIKKYADFLRKKLKNKFIKSIKILNGRYKKHGPFKLYQKLKRNLPIKVLDVKSKGKFIYIIFTNNLYLLNTCGLSGGWTYYNKSTGKYHFPLFLQYIDKELVKKYMKKSLNHRNVEFVIDTGSIFFYDTLSFGTLKVIDNKDELEKKLNTIGPDIMDDNTTYYIFKSRLEKYPDKNIGILLLNQKIISGFGNYLRADILWLSRISPFRKVNNITDNEFKKLYHNCKLLTWANYDYQKGIDKSIITKNDIIPFDFNRDFFIYRSEYDIYGNPVTKEELYEGSQKRFIYWVPELQK